MRMWSLHPALLDRQGLVAGWREALLAQAVLAGRTVGYRHHPQLQRFREQAEPLDAIGGYLTGLAEDAVRRGFNFNSGLILRPPENLLAVIPVTSGQLAWEWQHLLAKLARRSPGHLAAVRHQAPFAHPLFVEQPGGIAAWERAAG